MGGSILHPHKKIDESLETLYGTFHRLRQSGIEEEPFDVDSGFEALSTGHAGRGTQPRQTNRFSGGSRP